LWTFTACADPTQRISVDVQGPFATNNSESLRDAARAGLGIALLPDFSAREAIDNGQLQEVLTQWRPVEVFADHLFVVRPYTPRVSRAVEAFSTHLRTVFGD
jgi:DNA-binding transcriptional LysR family regulator